MSVDIQPIVRTRGDTYPFTVTFVDIDGAVLDLTGASFILTVSAEEDPTATQLPEFSLVGVVAAPLTGEIEFTMTESDADRFGLFYYDIQMTDVQGYVRTMLRGTFEMRQDITKEIIGTWTADDDALADGEEYPDLGGFWRYVLQASSPTVNYRAVYDTIDGRKVLRSNTAVSFQPIIGNGRLSYVFGLGDSIEFTVYMKETRFYFYLWDSTGYIGTFLGLDNRTGATDYITVYTRAVDGMAYSYAQTVDTTGWLQEDWYVFGFKLDLEGNWYFKFAPESSSADWIAATGVTNPRLREDDPMIIDVVALEPPAGGYFALRSCSWAKEEGSS